MAAGATYTPIATYTVSGSSTLTYTFSSIPSTYTDLVLVVNGSSSRPVITSLLGLISGAVQQLLTQLLLTQIITI
jgi:hypothetical protein